MFSNSSGISLRLSSAGDCLRNFRPAESGGKCSLQFFQLWQPMINISQSVSKDGKIKILPEFHKFLQYQVKKDLLTTRCK